MRTPACGPDGGERRHLYLMLDAFRAERAHPLPEPPMTPSQAYDAMVRLGGTGACTAT
ncbi:hypothetical protein ACFVY1_39175 [Streptomyces sp. NPDC058293]|uniref:Uncharacterized protein n=1 Tax=Streptomyces sp. NBC_00119 TaxID=2975659 RepID=A0AAU1UJG3_9ACTN|nr:MULTISPECIES: hypothetical protein [unclassified Streptomyces]MCX4647532.1 hypothetical protein [Streptomyces sp. NBC_01446]MCX5320109.1 hypothetical protein [Streptomyces sp. NBC_00120]